MAYEDAVSIPTSATPSQDAGSLRRRFLLARQQQLRAQTSDSNASDTEEGTTDADRAQLFAWQSGSRTLTSVFVGTAETLIMPILLAPVVFLLYGARFLISYTRGTKPYRLFGVVSIPGIDMPLEAPEGLFWMGASVLVMGVVTCLTVLLIAAIWKMTNLCGSIDTVCSLFSFVTKL